MESDRNSGTVGLGVGDSITQYLLKATSGVDCYDHSFYGANLTGIIGSRQKLVHYFLMLSMCARNFHNGPYLGLVPVWF